MLTLLIGLSLAGCSDDFSLKSLLVSKKSTDVGYTNPVLSGFHPDPSICCVGEDFYLVNSTFQFFPGVPIYHSKDLIHWEQLGHCLTRRSQLELHEADFWGGIYAPTLRYHEGMFYMIVTNCSGIGNFFVTAADPAGPWSDPIRVDEEGIDPTLFWDDDSTCYYVGNARGGIVLFAIDDHTGQRLSESQTIWEGTGGRYPEGPHIYKKDGWYYLLIAEGGTEMGHKVTIARSRDIHGPYKGCPHNPLLTHFNHVGEGNPIQGLGHADLVQAPDGSWWTVCLGFRQQSGANHLLGRETFLAPVAWKKGKWPVINGGECLQLEMECRTLPQVEVQTAPSVIHFDVHQQNQNAACTGNAFLTPFDMRLNFLCNPVERNYVLDAHPGWLRLRAGDVPLDGKGSPTFVGIRQTEMEQRMSAYVDVSGLDEGGRGGLTAYTNGAYHYDIAVVRRDGQYIAQVLYRLDALTHVESERVLPSQFANLSIECTPEYYVFSCNGEELGRMNTRFLSSECAGGFTGMYIGVFSEGPAGSYIDLAEIEMKDISTAR